MYVGSNESCFFYRDPANAKLGKCPDSTDTCIPHIKVIVEAFDSKTETARDIDKKRLVQAMSFYDFGCASAVIHKINNGRQYEILVNLTFHWTHNFTIDSQFAKEQSKRLIDYLQGVFPDIPMNDIICNRPIVSSVAKMVFGEQLYDLRNHWLPGNPKLIIDFGKRIFYAKDNKIKWGVITKMWSANDRICIEVQEDDNVDTIFYDDGVIRC